MIFEATLQGVDLKDVPDEPVPEESDASGLNIPRKAYFQDPSKYEGMTEEQKEAETQKLMKTLKHMVYDPEEKCTSPRKIFSGMRS